MNRSNRLQSTFPFLGGVLVLLIASMGGWRNDGILFIGAIMTMIGFYIMVRGNKSSEPRQMKTINSRATRID